jgi:uncharacterized membrane protein YeiB
MQPTTQNHIHNLDTIRGAAVLGILLNIVSFDLTPTAYFNISTSGMYGSLDWTIGVFGEIFPDRKFMGIFSLGFKGPYSRSFLLLVILFIWTLQLMWSQAWLTYYQYDPME